LASARTADSAGIDLFAWPVPARRSMQMLGKIRLFLRL
jgi:hypothetical protein